MRGFLCASMDKFPNDPLLAELSGEELLFMYHHKKKYLDDLFDKLAVMLGVRWRPEAVHAQPSKRTGPGPAHLDLPLSLAINPRLHKMLKEHTPKPKSAKLRNGEFEFEELNQGRNLIREHQRRLLSQATKILNA